MNILCHSCSYRDKINEITHPKCDVMWVGVSLKKCMTPQNALSPSSSSGNLLTKIEKAYTEATYYRTNILKCAPIDTTGKLRYPTNQEMENCYPFLKEEIQNTNPKIVFLLGGLVSKFVLNKLNIPFNRLPADYQYQEHLINGIKYVAVHHPSYINVYKRHTENRYIESIVKLIKNCIDNKMNLELPANPQLCEMIKLVIPSSKYQRTFISAVKEIKQLQGFISPSVKQFADYDLEKLENDFDNYIVSPLIDTMNGVNLPQGFVPATEFWIIKDEKFAGRICLRHHLTEFMAKYIGHIGYMVVPSFRKQGIAKTALKYILQEAYKMSLSEVLIICEEDNDISKHMLINAMNNFGGYEDTPQEKSGKKMLRYWIKTIA